MNTEHDTITTQDACPFLVPVIADRLWIYPISAYCRRPEHHARVPAAATFASVCSTPRHRECEGYRASRLSPGIE